jgi:hypothetical protein
MSYFFLLILGFFYTMVVDFNLKSMNLGFVKIDV